MTLTKEKLQPQTWQAMKQVMIEHRHGGIPESNLPSSFEVGMGMIQTFNEMMPPISIVMRTMRKAQASFRSPTMLADEVGRNIIVNRAGNDLLVQAKNDGIAADIPTGQQLEIRLHPRSIGMIHTHPIDLPASSKDLEPLITGVLQSMWIVTENRVHVLFRTPESVHFESPIHEGWVTDDQALAELKLARYEMSRTGKIFLRQV